MASDDADVVPIGTRNFTYAVRVLPPDANGPALLPRRVGPSYVPEFRHRSIAIGHGSVVSCAVIGKRHLMRRIVRRGERRHGSAICGSCGRVDGDRCRRRCFRTPRQTHYLMLTPYYLTCLPVIKAQPRAFTVSIQKAFVKLLESVQLTVLWLGLSPPQKF